MKQAPVSSRHQAHMRLPGPHWPAGLVIKISLSAGVRPISTPTKPPLSIIGCMDWPSYAPTSRVRCSPSCGKPWLNLVTPTPSPPHSVRRGAGLALLPRGLRARTLWNTAPGDAFGTPRVFPAASASFGYTTRP